MSKFKFNKIKFKKPDWKKILIVFAIVTVVFAGIGGFFKYTSANEDFFPIDTEKYSDIGPELKTGNFFEKEINASGGIRGFCAKINTNGEVKEGLLSFELLNDDSSLVQRQTFSLENVEDGVWFNVMLPKSQPSEDKNYIVKFGLEDAEENTDFKFFSSSEDNDIAVCPLKIDNSRQKYITGFLIALYVFTLIWTVCVFAFDVSAAKAFLLIGIVQVIFFNLVLPPISVPDEGVHFCTTYNYSNAVFGEKPELLENVDVYKNEYNIPARPQDAKVWNEVCDFRPHKGTYINIYRSFRGICGWDKESIAASNISPVINGVILDISPVCYLPGIIGITLARLLGLSGIMMIYSGRFFMSLAYLILCYFGIKKMPFNKSVLALTALLPMSLHLAASFSYDCVLIGYSIFWTGLIFHYAYEKESLNYLDFIAIAVSSLILSCGKGIYVLLLALILIIPAKKLGGKKKYALFISATAVLGIIFTLLNIGTRMDEYVVTENVTETYTISYIFTDFIKFVFQSLYTVLDNFEYYLNSMVGIHLGWLEITVSEMFVLPIVFMLFISSIKEKDNKYELTVFNRIVLIGIFLSILAVCVIAAMCWTSTDSIEFRGVQGRYLLPVLALLIMGIRSNKWLTLSKNIDKFLIGGMGCIDIFVLISAFNIVVSR